MAGYLAQHGTFARTNCKSRNPLDDCVGWSGPATNLAGSQPIAGAADAAPIPKSNGSLASEGREFP